MNHPIIETVLFWAILIFAVAVFIGGIGALMGVSSIYIWSAIQGAEKLMFAGFVIHMFIILYKKLNKEHKEKTP